MLGHYLDDSQWGQCLLKPRLGGIGIMDVSATASGAYYASILACLSVIAKLDTAKNLGLNPTLLHMDGSPYPSNQCGHLFTLLHRETSDTYDKAMKIDRDLSLNVLDSLPV